MRKALMTTIAIVPDDPKSSPLRYRAVAGERQSVGATPGQAVDALTAQLGEAQGATLIVVQTMHPDAFFNTEQQQRLTELMGRWRAARDAGSTLPPDEQTELDALIEAELRAAALRSSALIHQLPS
jgi:hypothetical protein